MAEQEGEFTHTSHAFLHYVVSHQLTHCSTLGSHSGDPVKIRPFGNKSTYLYIASTAFLHWALPRLSMPMLQWSCCRMGDAQRRASGWNQGSDRARASAKNPEKRNLKSGELYPRSPQRGNSRPLPHLKTTNMVEIRGDAPATCPIRQRSPMVTSSVLTKAALGGGSSSWAPGSILSACR